MLVCHGFPSSHSVLVGSALPYREFYRGPPVRRRPAHDIGPTHGNIVLATADAPQPAPLDRSAAVCRYQSYRYTFVGRASGVFLAAAVRRNHSFDRLQCAGTSHSNLRGMANLHSQLGLSRQEAWRRNIPPTAMRPTPMFMVWTSWRLPPWGNMVLPPLLRRLVSQWCRPGRPGPASMARAILATGPRWCCNFVRTGPGRFA